MPDRIEPAPCPICQGKGTVTYVDEEVCCQVEMPCWACGEAADDGSGQPAAR